MVRRKTKEKKQIKKRIKEQLQSGGGEKQNSFEN